MCDVGYLCANFSLPRPICSRLRPDVRERQTSDSIIALCLRLLGVGHNKLRSEQANQQATEIAYSQVT